MNVSTRGAVRPLPRSVRHWGVYLPHGLDDGVQWLTGIGARPYNGEAVPGNCVVIAVTDDREARVLPADQVDGRAVLARFLILATDLESVIDGSALLQH